MATLFPYIFLWTLCTPIHKEISQLSAESELLEIMKNVTYTRFSVGRLKFWSRCFIGGASLCVMTWGQDSQSGLAFRIEESSFTMVKWGVGWVNVSCGGLCMWDIAAYFMWQFSIYPMRSALSHCSTMLSYSELLPWMITSGRQYWSNICAEFLVYICVCAKKSLWPIYVWCGGRHCGLGRQLYSLRNVLWARLAFEVTDEFRERGWRRDSHCFFVPGTTKNLPHAPRNEWHFNGSFPFSFSFKATKSCTMISTQMKNKMQCLKTAGQ